jgi:hypothetical protein
MPRILVGTINKMVFVVIGELGYFVMNIEDTERFIEALQRSINILKEGKETGEMFNAVGHS